MCLYILLKKLLMCLFEGTIKWLKSDCQCSTRLTLIMEDASEELCLIDAGISSLRGLPVNSSLVSINLHCNCIRYIENLDKAYALRYLDLSSNQISSMDGLASLRNLETLNLSCNVIDHVTGLDGLVSLIYLDVSYNKIVNIDGFGVMKHSVYKLKSLLMHGNRLASVHDVCKNLQQCYSLRSLTLFAEGNDHNNPLCSTLRYRDMIFSSLPFLSHIDGVDIRGNCLLSANDSMTNFLELVPFACLTKAVAEGKSLVTTPRIDAALNRFHRSFSAADKRHGLDSAGLSCHCSASCITDEDQLKTVEQQIVEASSYRTSVDLLDERTSVLNEENNRCLRLAGNLVDADQSDLACFQIRTSAGGSGPSAAENSTSRRPHIEVPNGSEDAESVAASCFGDSKLRNVKQFECNALLEKKQRDDIRTLYVKLMKDLESERDSRLKAEEVSKCLSEQLKLALQRQTADQSLQEIQNLVKKLKQDLLKEKDLRFQAETEVENLKMLIAELQSRLDDQEQTIKDMKKMLDANEESVEIIAQNYLCKENNLIRQLEESKQMMVALTSDLEVAKSASDCAGKEVNRLHSLLVEREKVHKSETEMLQSLKAREVEEIISKAFAKAETVESHEKCVTKRDYDILKRKYSELEGEFRVALQMESDRFRSLQVLILLCYLNV
jgi:leucine-rich repeat/coiled-coil domain-containing protein 1